MAAVGRDLRRDRATEGVVSRLGEVAEVPQGGLLGVFGGGERSQERGGEQRREQGGGAAHGASKLRRPRESSVRQGVVVPCGCGSCRGGDTPSKAAR